jgi:hypothetical protein
MAILSLSEIFSFSRDDMAKPRGQKKQRVVDDKLLEDYVARLVRAGDQRPPFEAVLVEIKTDDRLKAADIVDIAHRYNGGGKKPSSKAMALAAISKRFVEIVRFHAKNKVAERVRPW